jgi:ribulose-5-phosphate 4-epimerase/fuculose-1-phosphate aldolase
MITMAADPRHDIVTTGQYLLAHQLAWGSTGNISARFDENSFFISASGASLGNLATDNLALCKIGSETLVSSIIPSKEHRVHAAIYHNNPKVNAVIHTSPIYTSLIAAAETEIQIPVGYFIESAVILQSIAWVPFMLPSSDELVEAVGAASRESDVIIMRNHGIMVTGDSMRKALNKVDTLEFLCRMFVTAKSAGIDLRQMTSDEIKHLLDEPRPK